MEASDFVPLACRHSQATAADREMVVHEGEFQPLRALTIARYVTWGNEPLMMMRRNSVTKFLRSVQVSSFLLLPCKLEHVLAYLHVGANQCVEFF
jgi:hypothetical protein